MHSYEYFSKTRNLSARGGQTTTRLGKSRSKNGSLIITTKDLMAESPAKGGEASIKEYLCKNFCHRQIPRQRRGGRLWRKT